MKYDIRSGTDLYKHTIDECPNPNDADFLPHRHSKNYELFYFVSGDADFNISGNFYEMRNGTLLLIKPGQVHNINFKSNKPYERIVLRFKEEDIDKKLAEKLRDTENVYFVRNSELSNEILRLDAHISNIDNDWILFTLQNSLQVILSYLVNYKPLETQYNFSQETQAITNYIEDNLVNINNIETICHDLNISKSALCKKFSDSVGIPIMTYVRLRKTVLANSLIQKGQKPTEVYQQCGFNDYTTFYRTYKKIYKQEPSATKILEN